MDEMITQTSFYKPSWANRFDQWVSRLPLPAWAFYALLGIILMLFALLILWTNGVSITRKLLILYAMTAASQAYFLGLTHYMDQFAGAALKRFRPVMMVDEAGYERLYYHLTTSPAGPAWIAFFLGMAYSFVILIVNLMSGFNPTGQTLPPVVFAMDAVYRLLLSGLAVFFAYHTIHQLRTVSLIYTRYTRINLFHLGPLAWWILAI